MITDNLARIQAQISTHQPKLIAVSKQQPDHRINEALQAGIRVYGENKVQEAMTRWGNRKLHYPYLELHLIGPLQTNKVKDAVHLFDCIHTLDREKLARHIHKHAPAMPCFIQVNVGSEPQKSGIATDAVDAFYKFCTSDLNMNIIGLMCIPPAGENPTPYFEWLQDKANSLHLPNLSMGMSNDYLQATTSGATHIRVGSALFGPRP